MKPLIYILCLLFFSCGRVDLIDDYVPPILRISNAVDELPIGSSFELRASYFNNVGELIQEAEKNGEFQQHLPILFLEKLSLKQRLIQEEFSLIFNSHIFVLD